MKIVVTGTRGYRSDPFFLEILPKGIDKAQSLERLLAVIGVKREEMIACGDGYNDLTMVQYAGLGVAMGNGVLPVRKAADYITLTNDKTIKCTVQKAAVCHNTVKQTLHITVIRHIAASLARNQDFLPDAVIFFVEVYLMSPFCRASCRHQPCRTAADHDNFLLHFSSPFSNSSAISRCALSFKVMSSFLPSSITSTIVTEVFVIHVLR